MSKQKERKLLWLVGLVISCCHQKNVYVVGLHPRGSSPPFPFFSWNNCRRLWQWTNGHPWFQRFMLVAKLAPSFFKDPPLSPGTLPDLQCRVIARASLFKVILYKSCWELFLLVQYTTDTFNSWHRVEISKKIKFTRQNKIFTTYFAYLIEINDTQKVIKSTRNSCSTGQISN